VLARKAAALGFVLSAAMLAGCGDPDVKEDPSYESSDVQPPPIEPLSPPFAGEFIAIVPFVNKTLSENRTLGDAAPDILVAYCIEAGFRVAEGQKGQLDEAMAELNFQQTDFVDAGTAARIGKMKGAKYVLVGAVTDYRVTKAKGKKKVDILGIVGFGGGEEALVYDVQVSSRIIDVETREVICADPGTAVKQKYAVSGGHVNVVGVRLEDSQSVTTEDESMGKVLKLAFARSMNKLIAQANRSAGRRTAAPAPAPAPSPVPEPGSAPGGS
jgi:curli biogenesis system outer membrane secretion channel CsgG